MPKRIFLALLSFLLATSLSAGQTGPAKGRGRGVAPASDPLRYLVAYDSALQGDWSVTTWEDPDHLVTVHPNAPAPGRSGNALEVQFSQNGWGAFGLANMLDWNDVHYMYLNEYKTIEFDLYIEPDATGMENLYLLLDDAGYSNEPQLVSYIAGWDSVHPEASTGRWIPVSIDLTQVGLF